MYIMFYFTISNGGRGLHIMHAVTLGPTLEGGHGPPGRPAATAMYMNKNCQLL